MQLLKMIQKEKINTPEIKDFPDTQTKLEMEIYENPTSNLISTIHPTWWKDFKFPKEVFSMNLPLCYMNGILPEKVTLESVFFFWDLLKNKKLSLFKGQKTTNVDPFLTYTQKDYETVLEAVSIQPHLFSSNAHVVKSLLDSNPSTPHRQPILDSFFDLLTFEQYTSNGFEISEKIDTLVKDFYMAKKEYFPSLSRVQQEKVIEFAAHFGHKVEDVLPSYEEIHDIRLLAHNHIEPQSIQERWVTTKQVSYFVHQNEINQAHHLMNGSPIHFRILQSQGVDLEFLGMNRIRKSDLVTVEDVELLKESMPFVNLKVKHHVLESGMMMTVSSLEGIELFQFKYILHGNEVYDVEILCQSHSLNIEDYVFSTRSMAIWMILSTIAKSTSCLLDGQVVEKFKVNEPNWR